MFHCRSSCRPPLVLIRRSCYPGAPSGMQRCNVQVGSHCDGWKERVPSGRNWDSWKFSGLDGFQKNRWWDSSLVEEGFASASKAENLGPVGFFDPNRALNDSGAPIRWSFTFLIFTENVKRYRYCSGGITSKSSPMPLTVSDVIITNTLTRERPSILNP